MVFAPNKRTQYRSQNTIIPIMGTPQKVPLILGNPHMQAWQLTHLGVSLIVVLNQAHLLSLTC